MPNDILLEVKHLVTSFTVEGDRIRVVDGVSFAVRKGETLGIVGESGCGKSVTALSIMRLLPKPSGRIEEGDICLGDLNIVSLSPDETRSIRGNRISMIFQEPMTALNPVHRVGKQLRESYALHHPGMSRGQIDELSIGMLEKVGIPDPRRRINEYPHQLSGGTRQRVMIAMALICEPEILIADEPTTALDVTIQAQILNLMTSLQKESGMSIVLITHDLGVIAETCDEVIVMYTGQVVERSPVRDLFAVPAHPYTQGLLRSIPTLDAPSKRRLNTIDGTVPDPRDFPRGCRFQNRCQFAEDRCCEDSPQPERVGENHFVSCFFWREIQSSGGNERSM